jgi:iron complex outermembrane receptor protein
LRTTESTEFRSILLADKIKLNEQWSILLGVNAPRVADTTWDTNSGLQTAQYAASRITPAGAVMFKPVPALTTYVAYTQSLQQGPIAPDDALNAGQALAPYLSTQIEVGAKATIGRIDLNLALFEIEKANDYTDPVTNLLSLDGTERHKGAEFTFTGKATDLLTLGGGFTMLDTTIVNADDASLIGKTPRGVPDYIATLFGEYALTSLPGLTLQGGATYTGREWVNAANTVSIPSVFLLNAGVRYQTSIRGVPATFRINVANLLDHRYWTNKGDDMLYTGNPRTVAFSMTMNF